MRLCTLVLLSIGMCWAGEAPAPDAVRAEALYNQALGMPTGQRIAALAEAARLCPTEARYWVALGDAYSAPAISQTPRLNQELPESKPVGVESARQVYLRAVQMAPRSPLPHLRLADLLWDSDRTAAAEHLDRAITLDPGNALPVYERAALCFVAGEDDEGRRLLDDARTCKAVRYPVLCPSIPFDVAQASCWFAQVQLPFLARLRELARQIVRVSDTLKEREPGEARALLLEGQRLGYRIMTGEPRLVIALAVGISTDGVVAKPLGSLLEAQGDAAARAALAARSKAMEALRARMRESVKDATARLMQERKAAPVLDVESGLARALLKESGIKTTIAD